VVVLSGLMGHCEMEVGSICGFFGNNNEPTRSQMPNTSPENKPHSTPYANIKYVSFAIFDLNSSSIRTKLLANGQRIPRRKSPNIGPTKAPAIEMAACK